MYLIELSFYEFRQFLQIVLWISLPLIIISLAVATFFHYRRKKKFSEYDINSGNPEEHAFRQFSFAKSSFLNSALNNITGDAKQSDGNDNINTSNNTSNNLNNTSTSSMYDNNNDGNNVLVKQYEQQLHQSKEKYQTLEKSFKKLQESYSDALSKVNDDKNHVKDGEFEAIQEKAKAYEFKIAQLQQSLDYIKTAKNEVSQQSTNDNKELIESKNNELSRLESVVKSLTDDLAKSKNESNGLRFELSKKPEGVVGKEQYEVQIKELKFQIAKIEEEKKSLKTSTGGGFVEDMVNQKNLQIEFLQAQLDQRIKQNHQLEQQHLIATETQKRLQQAIDQAQIQHKGLEDNINNKQKSLTTLQTQLNEQIHKNEQLQQAMQVKSYEITQFTNQLSELRYENATLYESVAESNQQLIQLEEKLDKSQLAAKELEEKWENNNQVLSRIYNELAGSLNNEISISATGTILKIRKDTNKDHQEHKEAKEAVA